MPEKCPFSMIQAAGSSQCRHAQEVVRRGGSEYDCLEPASHAQCTALVEHLNSIALPALGYEDDLTQTPKSVYERIMAGGLQALRIAVDPQDNTPETADIWSAVAAGLDQYGSPERIPADAVIPVIEAFQLKKRQRKRR